MGNIKISNPTRLRVRKIDEHALAREARTEGFAVAHGGTVCNSYGYRAETEAGVAYRLADGTVRVFITRIPANKATLSGVCRAIASEYDDCVAEWLIAWADDRYSRASWVLVRTFVWRYLSEQRSTQDRE